MVNIVEIINGKVLVNNKCAILQKHCMKTISRIVFEGLVVGFGKSLVFMYLNNLVLYKRTSNTKYVRIFAAPIIGTYRFKYDINRKILIPNDPIIESQESYSYTESELYYFNKYSNDKYIILNLCPSIDTY